MSSAATTIATEETLIQLTQKLGEITVARLRGGGFKSAPQGGGDAGVGGRDVYLDDPTIHGLPFRFRNMLLFRFHSLFKRPNMAGSFVKDGIAAMTAPQ